MPAYDYRCPGCRKTVEVRAADRPLFDHGLHCPDCPARAPTFRRVWAAPNLGGDARTSRR